MKVKGRGFEELTIGETITTSYGELELVSKNRMNFHKCPFCKSKKTYHSKCMAEGLYDNVFISEGEFYPTTSNYYKKDLCLKCGFLWVFEIYIYKVLLYYEEEKSFIRRVKNWLRKKTNHQ